MVNKEKNINEISDIDKLKISFGIPGYGNKSNITVFYEMDRTYKWTNKLMKLYPQDNFNDKKILTITGSGEHALEATKIISSAKGSLQAEMASKILLDITPSTTSAKDEKTLELAKLFASSKDISSFHSAFIVVKDENVKYNDYSFELAKVLLESRSSQIATYASDVARNIKVLVSGKVIELTKIVSKAIDIE